MWAHDLYGLLIRAKIYDLATAEAWHINTLYMILDRASSKDGYKGRRATNSELYAAMVEG